MKIRIRIRIRGCQKSHIRIRIRGCGKSDIRHITSTEMVQIDGIGCRIPSVGGQLQGAHLL